MAEERADPTLERARLLTQVASQAADDVALEMKRYLANAESRRKEIQQSRHPSSPVKPISDPGSEPWGVAVFQGSALVTTKGDLRRVVKRGMRIFINGAEYFIKSNGELSAHRFELTGDYDGKTDMHASLVLSDQVNHSEVPASHEHTTGQISRQLHNTPPGQPQPPTSPFRKQGQYHQQQHAAEVIGTQSSVPRSRRFITKAELPEALSHAVDQASSRKSSKRNNNANSTKPTPPEEYKIQKQPSNATSEQSSAITARASKSPLQNMDLPPRNLEEAETFRQLRKLQQEQQKREAEEKRVMSERAAAVGYKQAKKRAKTIMQQLREKQRLKEKLQQPLSAEAKRISEMPEEDATVTVHNQPEYVERARQKALLRVHQRKEDDNTERRKQEDLMRQQELERQERSKQMTERHQVLARRRVAERAQKLKEQQQVEELLQQQITEEKRLAEEARIETAQVRATALAHETRRRIQRRERQKQQQEQMEQNRIQQLLQAFESSNRQKYLSYLPHSRSSMHAENASVQSQSQQSQRAEDRRPSSMRASPLPPLVESEKPLLRTRSEQKKRPKSGKDSVQVLRHTTTAQSQQPKQFLPHIPNTDTAAADTATRTTRQSWQQHVREDHDLDLGSEVSDDSIGMTSHPAPMNPQDDQYSTVSSMTGVSGLKQDISDARVARKKPTRPIWRMMEPIPIKPFVEVPKKDDFSNMRNYASPTNNTIVPP